jgi:hypothetical protein
LWGALLEKERLEVFQVAIAHHHHDASTQNKEGIVRDAVRVGASRISKIWLLTWLLQRKSEKKRGRTGRYFVWSP